MKKGFALITVIAVLILIALGTATVLQSVGNQNTMKFNNLQEVRAQYLAEAGMQQALWQCRQLGGCVEAPGNVIDITVNGAVVHVPVPIDVTALATGGFKIYVAVDYTNL